MGRADVAVFDALDTPGTLLELARRAVVRPLTVHRILLAFRACGAVEAVTVDGNGASALWYRSDSLSVDLRAVEVPASPRAETRTRNAP